MRSNKEVIEINKEVDKIKWSVPEGLLVKCEGVLEGKPRTMEELAELTANNIERLKVCTQRQNSLVDVIVEKQH